MAIHVLPALDISEVLIAGIGESWEAQIFLIQQPDIPTHTSSQEL